MKKKYKENKTLLKIDEEYLEQSMIDKRILMIFASTSTIIWFGTVELIMSMFVEGDLYWFSFFISVFLLFLSYKSMKWYLNEMKFLKNSVYRDQHGEHTNRRYVRI